MNILKKILTKVYRLTVFRIHPEILVEDLIELTVQRFWTKKLRVFLTVIGIGIGIGAVFFLVSLTFGLQKLVIGNLATSDSLLSLDVVANTELNDFVKLDSSTVEKIKKLEHVELVSASKSLPAEMSIGNAKTQTIAYGVDETFFRLSNISTDQGDLFTDKDENKAVVSSAILTLFDMKPEEAVGKKFRIALINSAEPTPTQVPQVASLSAALEATAAATVDTTPKIEAVTVPIEFTIAGVVTDETDYFFVPQKTFEVVDFDEYKALKVKITDQEFLEVVREEILGMGFIVSAVTDTLKQINQIFQYTQMLFTIIGIVALFIAAIGMFNTMTIALLERTREIGIMKSIGATDKLIQQMFLAESVFMGLGGGIAGLILGFLFTVIFNILINVLALSLGGKWIDIFYTPPWFIVLALCFSVFIGFGTGYFPARRAAKINPLDALRYE